ncbi:MAG: transcriptional repressor [Clostridia bacterium]|nr:transcriptional repressor [Clostridia bacterium]
MPIQLKHSRQRDALLSLLQSVYSHPTAEWLYENLKMDFPNISLATVYRNLNLLCEQGMAMRVDVGDDKNHFDANTKNHYHFLCKGCRSVIDVSNEELSDVNLPVEEKFGFKVDTHSLVFFGLCDKCR